MATNKMCSKIICTLIPTYVQHRSTAFWQSLKLDSFKRKMITVQKSIGVRHTSSAGNWLSMITSKNSSIFPINCNNKSHNRYQLSSSYLSSSWKRCEQWYEGIIKSHTPCWAMTERLHDWHTTMRLLYSTLQSCAWTTDRTRSVQNLAANNSVCWMSQCTETESSDDFTVKLSTPRKLRLLTVNDSRK